MLRILVGELGDRFGYLAPSPPDTTWALASRSLGLAACEQGRRVRYVITAQLVNELVEAADERIVSRVVARYGRLDLLCLDELLSQLSIAVPAVIVLAV